MLRAIPAVLLACAFASPGAVVRAQTPREPRIEILPLKGTLMNDKGVTVTSLEVSYTIEFVPKDAVRAEVLLLKDDEVVRRFPAPLKAGLNKVTLPPGLQLDNPFNLLTAKVELPDGRLSESSYRSIYEAEQFERRDLLARARFERVVPDLITARGAAQFVRIIGTELAPLADRVTIGIFDVEARVVGNALRVTVPPALFELPGFEVISPRTDVMGTPTLEHQRLFIAIADPKLPKPGGLGSVRIDGVDYFANEYKEELHVRGAGFLPGMQIVIGRGRTPVVGQPAEMRSTDLLTTWLPSGTRGDGYFVAVLSADGKQLSKAFPIPPPDRMRATRGVAPAKAEEPRMTAPGFRVFGDVAWNKTPQWIYLEGPIARPGMRVWLRRDDAPVPVEAVAAEPAMTAGRKHPVVRVPVPPELTRRAVFNLVVSIHTK